MNRIEEGLTQIHESVIKYVLEFLRTGVFRNKTTDAYMSAYRYEFIKNLKCCPPPCR